MKKLVTSALIGSVLASIIYVEGGYTNDPDDAGGETKYGVTAQVAREYGYTGAMEDLTKEEATKIYTELYVNEPGFDKVFEVSPAVGHKLIDAGVNVGTMRVSDWFQETLNKYSRDGKDYPKVAVDGKVGNLTVTAFQSLIKKRGEVKACELVLKALDGYQTTYYLNLSRYAKYTVGWIDNRIGNVPLSQCKEYNLDILNTGSNNEN